MSEILIGHSYYLRFDPKLWDLMQPYPPLGMLYAAGYVRRQGFDVAVFDSMLAPSPRSWEAALDAERPRVAVLFEDNFNYLSKMCLLRMREAAFEMIRAASERGCTVAVCGSDATDRAAAYLRAGADYVLVGEGEATLAELLEHLDGDPAADVRSVRGLAFAGPDGEVVRTPSRPVLTDLDRLPRPAWELVDVERYRDIWLGRHGYFSLNMVTSRGCPFHCNWCAKPVWGQRYNARSPEDVVGEMAWLKSRYQPDHFWFMDDMMGIKPGWTAGFADLVQSRGIKTPFKSLNRVDLLLRDGEVDALRRAGCDIVWTGVESGSQRILDAMEKGIRVDQVRQAAARLHDAGIRVGFFLQFGYPGETRTDIRKTFQLVRDCRPDQIGVSVSYPLPGTPFFEAVREQLGAKQNWEDSDDLAMMYRGPFSTRFYRRLHTALHKEFRMRKAADRIRSSLQRNGRTGRNEGRSPDRVHPSRIETSGAAGLLRETAAFLYHATTLPLARVRVHVAATRPHQGIAPVRARLTPERAAVPSPLPGDSGSEVFESGTSA